MKLSLVTAGTRGDVQPHLALGVGLQRAGYDVKLVTHTPFEAWIRSHGLEFAPLHTNPQEILKSEAGQAALKTAGNPLQYIRRFAALLEPFITAGVKDTLEACQDADLLLTSNMVLWAMDISEKLQIPMAGACMQPISPTRVFPNVSTPPQRENLGGLYNRATYSAIGNLYWQLLRKPIAQSRQTVLGLKPIPFWKNWHIRQQEQNITCLYGFSPTIVPRPQDWPKRLYITGYWYLDQAQDFVPPPKLVDFLEAGPPPVYLGFGSMTGEEAGDLIKLAVQALKRTSHRGILLSGWAQIPSIDLGNQILQINDVPHDWLFPRMACIIHHGGAGTTGAALRAGIPQLVIPFFADQPFWGYRATKLGVSPAAVSRPTLTVERLAALIDQAIKDEILRAQAARVGQQIRQENGVAQAVQVIGDIFGK